MNAYDYYVRTQDGKRLDLTVIAEDQTAAEAQLRASALDGVKFLDWHLNHTTRLSGAPE